MEIVDLETIDWEFELWLERQMDCRCSRGEGIVVSSVCFPYRRFRYWVGLGLKISLFGILHVVRGLFTVPFFQSCQEG